MITKIKTIDELRVYWAKNPKTIFSYNGEYPVWFKILRFSYASEIKVRQRRMWKPKISIVDVGYNAKNLLPCYVTERERLDGEYIRKS